MFGFINDFVKKLNLKDDFKYVCIDNSFVCVQGFTGVLKIDQINIILKNKHGEFAIYGENLVIKELSQEEIIIVGNILKMER